MEDSRINRHPEIVPFLKEKESKLTPIDQITPDHQHARPVLRAMRYLGERFLVISITIFVGVFITVLIANQPSQRGLGPPVSPFETSLEAQIYLVVQTNINDGTIRRDSFGVPDQNQVKALTEQLRNDMGLNLPNHASLHVMDNKSTKI